MANIERQTVFVTVGTTCFDALVKAVDSPEVKKALQEKGYTHLVIQRGRGTYIPSKFSGGATLQVDHFTFSPSIADYMGDAALVISHAGSGSIFETLRLGKPLIVVVNEDLMDNHQSELAEELAERKHLCCAGPQTLERPSGPWIQRYFSLMCLGMQNQLSLRSTNFLAFQFTGIAFFYPFLCFKQYEGAKKENADNFV